jgi:hypothetical protein
VLCEIIIQVKRRTGRIDDEDLSHFDIQKSDLSEVSGDNCFGETASAAKIEG